MTRIEGWKPLSPDRTAALSDARQNAYFAAQVVSALGATHLPLQAFGSHGNLTWSDEAGGVLVGRPVSGLRAALDIAGLRWMVLDSDGGIHAFQEANGRPVAAGLSWLRDVLSEHGVRPLPLELLPHSLPDSPIRDGAPLSAEHADDLAELARIFSNARALLAHVTADLPQVSEPRVWPHQFDTGCAQVLSDTSMVGFGVSPGDAHLDAPYLYAWPWPVPDAAERPALPAGRWDDRGEDGLFAVLPLSELPAGGDAQADLALHWLTAALGACRSVAG
jgi:hypothetical protein